MFEAANEWDGHDRTGTGLPQGVAGEIARLRRLAAWRSEDIGFEAFCRYAVSFRRVRAWTRAVTERIQVKREGAVVRHVACRAWGGRHPVGRWVNELAF
jgi:hypothetical protein